MGKYNWEYDKTIYECTNKYIHKRMVHIGVNKYNYKCTYKCFNKYKYNKTLCTPMKILEDFYHSPYCRNID